MSQRDALQALDARIHGALSAAGLGDLAQYRAPGAALNAPGQICRVYIEHGALQYGDLGQVVGRVTQATVLRADLTPARGGSLQVEGGATVYRFTKLVDEDDGVTTWVVSEPSAP